MAWALKTTPSKIHLECFMSHLISNATQMEEVLLSDTNLVRTSSRDQEAEEKAELKRIEEYAKNSKAPEDNSSFIPWLFFNCSGTVTHVFSIF